MGNAPGGAGDVGEAALAAADRCKTARACTWSENSADSDSWAETTSGLTGLASSLERKDLVPSPFSHLAQMIGRPPVIRAASKASAAESPAIAATSAGF